LFRSQADVGNTNLKILVMSATLDSESIARILGDAPIVASEGRLYPVDIIYGRARQSTENIVDRVIATIKQALEDDPESSLLVFLPGQGEIRSTTETLADWLVAKKIRDVHLRPLYGNLSIEEQQLAIAPLSGKQSKDRKVVLATNIAESSLTIEGVDVVVDSGLERESRFNPATGMSGLHTTKISDASSQQRAGRAGRLGPGKCYRLWSAEQQQQLAAQGTAEILQADLAPLALQLLDWGVGDPAELIWLDPPPRGHWQQALGLLELLGALEASYDCAASASETRTSAVTGHRIQLRLASSAVSQPVIRPRSINSAGYQRSARHPAGRNALPTTTQTLVRADPATCPSAGTPVSQTGITKTRDSLFTSNQPGTGIVTGLRLPGPNRPQAPFGRLPTRQWPQRESRGRASPG
jgi:HrpA-like RNA helicase